MSAALPKIPRTTRNNIFDALRLENTFYAGSIGDIDFLGRLYDLRSLPSYDTRFATADQDIWQHCENNDDWPPDWVFTDPRFDLLNCSDQDFLKFLCETVHPVVRPDGDEARRIVGFYNEQLNPLGIQLVPSQKIAGRSLYIWNDRNEFRSQIGRAQVAAETLSSNWMQDEISRIQNAIHTDPALAIGTSKGLVESCCKAILKQLPNAEKPEPTDDLPKLAKKLCRALKLLPDDVPKAAKGADSIKRTLSNLASITKGIAELRGLYGSGHGRDGEYVGLEPRHARLAGSCAIAFVDFATETYLKRKDF